MFLRKNGEQVTTNQLTHFHCSIFAKGREEAPAHPGEHEVPVGPGEIAVHEGGGHA